MTTAVPSRMHYPHIRFGAVVRVENDHNEMGYEALVIEVPSANGTVCCAYKDATGKIVEFAVGVRNLKVRLQPSRRMPWRTP